MKKTNRRYGGGILKKPWNPGNPQTSSGITPKIQSKTISFNLNSPDGVFDNANFPDTDIKPLIGIVPQVVDPYSHKKKLDDMWKIDWNVYLVHFIRRSKEPEFTFTEKDKSIHNFLLTNQNKLRKIAAYKNNLKKIPIKITFNNPKINFNAAEKLLNKMNTKNTEITNRDNIAFFSPIWIII